LANASLPNVVSLTVRNDADTHVPVRIYGERFHAATTDIHGLAGLSRARKRTFQQLPIFGSHFRPMQIESNNFLWRKANFKRRLRTINAGIQQRIKFELDSQFLLGKCPHRDNFVSVDSSADSLQLERQPALHQQADATHAAIVTSGQLGQRLIRFFGATIECDLDRERRIFAKVIRDLLVDQNSIGEEGYDEIFLLGERVYLEEVSASENFSTGKQQPDHSHVRELS